MSVFEDKKVFVRFLNRDKSFPKKHPLFGGKHEKASIEISAPHFEEKPVRIFDTEEIEELQKKATEDVSFTNKEFWQSGVTRFSLTKTGMTLDLNYWVDVIRYRILTNDIYANLIGKGDVYPPTCKFELSTEEESSAAAKITDKVFEMAAWYGKYQDNEEILRYVYWKVNGGKISLNEKIDKIRIRIKELIDLEKSKFYRTTQEKYLDEKGLLFHAMTKQVVDNTNMGFNYKGTKLYDGVKGNFEDSAKWLADNSNQPTKLEIRGELS